MSEKLGIYIHIPFCRSKCPYCDFFTFRADKCETENYVNVLCDKIKFWGKKVDKTVDTIYLGGGTPSILSAETCGRIIDTVKNSFNVENNAEITIEVNPFSGRSFDFGEVYKHGVNRVSVGVQTVNTEEFKKLGRIHSLEDVKNTIEQIKSSGINNFSLDLMLGIPDQTLDTLKQTLNFFVESGAKHISSYMLKIEENTVFYKRKDKYNFPDDELTADMYLYTVAFLEQNGFNQYEISNFAKSGFESRHNLKYWMLDDYLGIGPAAHSMMDGKRFFYSRSMEDFKNGKITDDGNAGDVFEYIMLRLRLAEGVDIDELNKAFGQKIAESFINAAKLYLGSGYMINADRKYRLTPKGFLISNSIIADISNRI